MILGDFIHQTHTYTHTYIIATCSQLPLPTFTCPFLVFFFLFVFSSSFFLISLVSWTFLLLFFHNILLFSFLFFLLFFLTIPIPTCNTYNFPLLVFYNCSNIMCVCRRWRMEWWAVSERWRGMGGYYGVLYDVEMVCIGMGDLTEAAKWKPATASQLNK